MSSRRWILRLVSGAVAGASAFVVVWAMDRIRGIPDPYFFRILLAGTVAAVFGMLGHMFVDEVARR